MGRASAKFVDVKPYFRRDVVVLVKSVPTYRSLTCHNTS
jgi:hypothetical protein